MTDNKKDAASILRLYNLNWRFFSEDSLVLLLHHLRRFIRLLASCPWTDHLQMICRHCVMARQETC